MPLPSLLIAPLCPGPADTRQARRNGAHLCCRGRAASPRWGPPPSAAATAVQLTRAALPARPLNLAPLSSLPAGGGAAGEGRAATRLRSAPSGSAGPGRRGGAWVSVSCKRRGDKEIEEFPGTAPGVLRFARWRGQGTGRRPVPRACGPWKFQRELGKTGPRKAPPECTYPGPLPGGGHTEGLGLGEGLHTQGRRGCAGSRSLRNGEAPLKPPKSLVLPHTATCSFIVFISLIIAEIPFAYFVGNFSYMT